MIQPVDDEKIARYNVLTLMLQEKFHEAESLLNSYVKLRIMDKSYSDFYYRILEAIHVPQTVQAEYVPRTESPRLSEE